MSAAKDRAAASMILAALLHRRISNQFQSLMSTKWPAIAAAAAIAGETKGVRPLNPCRPSKFRCEVKAQLSHAKANP